jgi:hypothetical protein
VSLPQLYDPAVNVALYERLFGTDENIVSQESLVLEAEVLYNKGLVQYTSCTIENMSLQYSAYCLCPILL